MNIAIQLFARDGNLVDTVSIHKHAEIVCWKAKYYALRDGRYVDSDVVFASPATAQYHVLGDTAADKIVTTQVQMR